MYRDWIIMMRREGEGEEEPGEGEVTEITGGFGRGVEE